MWKRLSRPEAHGAVVAAGYEGAIVVYEGDCVDTVTLAGIARAAGSEIPDANAAVE